MSNYDNWCNICKYREFNFQQGIVCGYTREKPKINPSCPYFIYDPEKAKTIELKKRNDERKANEKANLSQIYPPWWSIPLGLIIVILIFILEKLGVSSKMAPFIAINVIFGFVIIYFAFSIKIVPVNCRTVEISEDGVNVLNSGIHFSNPFRNKYKKYRLNNIVPDWKNKKDYDINQEVLKYHNQQKNT